MNPAIYFFSTLTQSAPYTPTELPLLNGQIWDAKNLNTYRYRNGDVITNKITGWWSTTQGGWRYYNDNPINGSIYGKLYNWYAVSDSRNIAPVGWRVATNDDWSALSNFLSGDTNSGGALKATGTTLWTSPNTSATNSVGFTALPGGFKSGADSTSFLNIKSYGYWWTSNSGIGVRMDYNNNNLVRESALNLTRGEYVRLIKEDVTISGFTTLSATNINALSFNGGGEFTNLPYTPEIYDKGITWSTLSNPNILANSYISAGSGTTNNPYDIPVSGLSANTTYYIRAYAKISGGTVTAYAPQISATTLTGQATLTTSAATNISYTTATCGGNITNDAGYPITSRGVCWSTSPNPTIALSTKTVNGSGIGEFTSNLTNLSNGVTYYVRAYATNAATTAYGNEISFSATAAVGVNLIYEEYAANHAYSLRKLSSTYLGKCIRVRRTNATPNTSTVTVDVDFNTGGTISFDSPITFVSGTGGITGTSATTLGQFAAATISGYTNPDGVNENQSVYVVTWFNQSDNNNSTNENPTQATLASQPRIITNGIAEIIGGTIAMRFSGAQFLTVNNSTVPYSNASFYVLGSATSTATNSIYSLGFLNNNARLFIPRQNGISYNNNSAITWDWLSGSIPFTANTQRLYGLVCGDSTASAYSNGTQITPPSTVPALLVNSVFIRIGSTGSPAFYTTGTIQEIISFSGTSNRTSIENNINTYYNIWT
jgi:uncharacterized protein (TIGR02145 family)